MEGSALLQCMSKSPTGQRWNALVSARSSHTEQVAQGGCGCPIPGGTQGQAGCGSGQPGLVVGDPAHSRGLKLDDHCGPFQPRPSYDFSKMLSALHLATQCWPRVGVAAHVDSMPACGSGKWLLGYSLALQ